MAVRLRLSARRRPKPPDRVGKEMITTNCGRNSTALVTISPAAYRPAASAGSTLRAMITSTLERAKNASSAKPLCSDSVTTARPVCRSLTGPCSVARAG